MSGLSFEHKRRLERIFHRSHALKARSLGIAKVQMGSAEEANRAIEIMNHTTLNGRVLVVFKEPETNAKLPGGGSST